MTDGPIKADWINRFMSRLEQLIPGTPTRRAHLWAHDTYRDACDLSPEEAAEIFALELPPLDVGAPE